MMSGAASLNTHMHTLLNLQHRSTFVRSFTFRARCQICFSTQLFCIVVLSYSASDGEGQPLGLAEMPCQHGET